jgi:hypothetical protein
MENSYKMKRWRHIFSILPKPFDRKIPPKNLKKNQAISKLTLNFCRNWAIRLSVTLERCLRWWAERGRCRQLKCWDREGWTTTYDYQGPNYYFFDKVFFFYRSYVQSVKWSQKLYSRDTRRENKHIGVEMVRVRFTFLFYKL